MPEKTLKILYLEDNVSDAELIISRLRGEGFKVEFELVSDEKEYLRKLDSMPFDLILSDFNLPGYTGMSALKTARASHPEIPFICVSGTIGEDLAVEILKQGASDYVLKDKPDKLPLAIRRSLKEVEEQRSRKLAEQELVKLSRAVEYSPASISITDPAGTIEYVNPRFCDLSGYENQELIGKNSRILKSGLMPEEVYRDLWTTIRTGKTWQGELINKNKAGEYYRVNKSITPIHDEEGQITHFVTIAEDITEKKKTEEELIRAKEKAEESDRLKSAFLATMSHELRTPLNAIIGFSELIEEGISPEQIQSFSSHINKSGKHLLQLVEDMFDISLIETGKMKIFREAINPAKILDEVGALIESEQFKMNKTEIRITPFIPEREDGFIVYTDPHRLRQILLNLLKNALKFTKAGSIEYGFKEENHSEIPIICFYVKDTGIGIPKEKQNLIFEMFRQADDSHTRQYDGTGIGLSIARKLTELLGGRIWVESGEGIGSTFYFTIPVTHSS